MSPGTAWIPGDAIGEWARRYDAAGIEEAAAPPASLRRIAGSVECVIASDRRRSVESAALLVPPARVRIEPDLREAGLPDGIGTSLRLPPGAWVMMARIAWLLGRCAATETRVAARQRAARVTDGLCARAAQHGSVLVVGHGMFNRFIAAELLRRGWRGPRLLPSGYWTSATYVLQSSASARAGERGPAASRPGSP